VNKTLDTRLELYLYVSRILFESGATVSKIQNSLSKLKTYFEDFDVHVAISYESIIVSRNNKGLYETKVSRKRLIALLNLSTLEAIHCAIDTAIQNKADEHEIRKLLLSLKREQKQSSSLILYSAYMCAAMGFAILNGANFFGLLVTLPAALVLILLRSYLAKRKSSYFASLFWSAGVATLIATLLAKFIPTGCSLIAILAILLPLVPGFSIITSGLDIFSNNNSVGLGRATFALFTLWILCLCMIIPLALFPQEFATPALHLESHLGLIFSEGIFAGIASLSLGVLFRCPRRLFLWIFIGGVIARCVRTSLLSYYHLPLPLAALIGAMVISLLIFFLSTKLKVSASTFSLICVLPMIPGYLILHGFEILFLMLNDSFTLPLVLSCLELFSNAFFTLLALVSGILFPLMLLQRKHHKL